MLTLVNFLCRTMKTCKKKETYPKPKSVLKVKKDYFQKKRLVEALIREYHAFKLKNEVFLTQSLEWSRFVNGSTIKRIEH